MGNEINDSGLLESLVEDIREFTDGMEASEGEWGYSLRKVKNTLERRRVWEASLRGNSLELTVNEWSLHLFLREGVLQVGWEEIPLPTFDMAVATLNHLEGILPWYITRVRALKDKTSLEEARIKQLNRICEATVMPAIGPMAEAASLICTVRARNDSVSIVLKDRKGKSRSFRIGFERPIQDSLGPVMEYIKSVAAKGAGNISPAPCCLRELCGISRALRNRSRSDGSRPSGSRTRTGAYTPP